MTSEGLKTVKEKDEQNYLTRHTRDSGEKVRKSNKSEMTSYRIVAMILDLILDNSKIDMIE